MADTPSLAQLNELDDSALQALDWKNLPCLNGRLLELHAEGALNNAQLAKLPRRPILCIDQIETINDDSIEASFRFPDKPTDWAFDPSESLEMLFQDQLDQLVGFWGCRKVDGIGRALSSGQCTLHQSLDLAPGKTIRYQLQKRKWVPNKTGGTAVFNGRIIDEQGELILETKSVIVGILPPADIAALRKQYGGEQGVANPDLNASLSGLRIPIYDQDSKATEGNAPLLERVTATQAINPELWPLQYHFHGDPVVPGNFGTHGMIALLKDTAQQVFGLSSPVFKAMKAKKFSGMIFEDPKQICFELLNVTQNDAGEVVAEQANLYLQHADGSAMIEAPIYTFKQLTVAAS